MKKKSERDKKGRFVKGHKGGPGRSKGEPKDVICKDGKKRSIGDLISDLLAAYQTMGGEKFLKKWAKQSNRNLTKFIEILFKFAPHPDVVPGDTSIKVISAVPRSDDRATAKRIRELEAKLREKEEELKQFRTSVDVQDIKEIQHEPVRPAALPEHVKKPKARSDEHSPGGETSWENLERLSDEKLEKRLKKLPEKKMLELYKKLEREVGLRIDPENYRPPVIIRNFLLLWTRRKDDLRRRKAIQDEELVPLTEKETDKIFSKGSGLAEKVTRISDDW